MKKEKCVPRWRQFFLLSFVLTLLWTSPALCIDVTLAWDPNSEADLGGYGVYFRQGSAGPPYYLAGYVLLDEFDNPQAPSFTVTGLQEGTQYYFAATALDVDGNESSYSSSVCADIAADGTISACAPSSDNSSTGGTTGVSSVSSGGGGRGDGGCFITSSAQVPENLAGTVYLVLVLAGGFAAHLLAMRSRQRS
jgi:hypothetical protein